MASSSSNLPDGTEFSSIEEAVEDIRQGKFVVVLDDEDRENEGDLIIAADKITTEQMAWLIRWSRCVDVGPWRDVTKAPADVLDFPRPHKQWLRLHLCPPISNPSLESTHDVPEQPGTTQDGIHSNSGLQAWYHNGNLCTRPCTDITETRRFHKRNRT